MGHTSKELKEVAKKVKEKEYPVKNKDYYVVRVARGETAYPGWITSTQRLSQMTRARVLEYIKGPVVDKSEKVTFSDYRWYAYPGPRPNPKWGPVCP